MSPFVGTRACAAKRPARWPPRAHVAPPRGLASCARIGRPHSSAVADILCAFRLTTRPCVHTVNICHMVDIQWRCWPTPTAPVARSRTIRPRRSRPCDTWGCLSAGLLAACSDGGDRASERWGADARRRRQFVAATCHDRVAEQPAPRDPVPGEGHTGRTTHRNCGASYRRSTSQRQKPTWPSRRSALQDVLADLGLPVGEAAERLGISRVALSRVLRTMDRRRAASSTVLLRVGYGYGRCSWG